MKLTARNRIPNTDLEVSPLCLGTMTFGVPVEEPRAIAMIHACIDDLGINYFDTANVYEGYDRVRSDDHVSEGKVAELICGKAFASRTREEFVIATKVGSPLPVNGGTLSLAPEHILSECDGSRERLGVDQIDIYYAHWPDGNGVPVEASCGAFAQLVREGKIKHWAISNHSVAQTKEVLAICDAKGWPRPVMHQPPFSLLKPDHARDLLPYCAQQGIAVCPYNVLQGGYLSGKYSQSGSAPADSRAVTKPAWAEGNSDIDGLWEKLGAIERAAAAAKRTMLQHTLVESLATVGITSLILGASRLEQVEQAVAALTASASL